MDEAPGSISIWKPCCLHRARGGNERKLDGFQILVGERIETQLNAAQKPREIGSLGMKMSGDRLEVDEEGQREKMVAEANGISVEREFTFLKAVVGEFLREEVRGGGFMGNYVLNLKDQLRVGSLSEDESNRKVTVMLTGLSQPRRKKIGDEMAKKHGDKEEVVGSMRIEGKNIVGKMEKAMKVIKVNKEKLDVVLFGGTKNSLVVHGK